MTHANAPFTPTGRERLARLIVIDGWPIRRAAERFQCSPATAAKWAARFRAGQSMRDRSSRPASSPNRLPTRLERRIIALRLTRRWGPHRIAFHLHLARSTVGRVLARFRMPLLRNRDANRKVGYVSAAKARLLAPEFDRVNAPAYRVNGEPPMDKSALYVSIPHIQGLRALPTTLQREDLE